MSRVSFSIFAPILYAGSTRSAVAEAVAPWHAAWKSEALGAEELLNLHALVQLNGANRFFFSICSSSQMMDQLAPTLPSGVEAFWGLTLYFMVMTIESRKIKKRMFFLLECSKLILRLVFLCFSIIFTGGLWNPFQQRNTAATFLNHP